MIKKNLQKKKIKTISIVTLATVFIVLIMVVIVSDYMAEYTIARSGDGGNRDEKLEKEDKEVKELSQEEIIINNNLIIEEQKSQAYIKEAEEMGQLEHVSVTSDDGLKLDGIYVNNEGHKWAIVVHGYRGSYKTMLDYTRVYHQAGYQVVSPSLRACGDSEGNYLGMGWLDRKDLLNWIDWIIEKDEDAEIVLHGVSMGAAAVMMTAGENTPEQVKLFIEECGYSSVDEILASELKVRFKLPSFPIINMAGVITKLKAGYDFSEGSALKQVQKCEKPMLFIHGTADDFVPFKMEKVLYDAKPGDNKDIVTVEGAGHCYSWYLVGQEYWDKVFEFIDKYN